MPYVIFFLFFYNSLALNVVEKEQINTRFNEKVIPRIVNGQRVEKVGDIPYQVSLTYPYNPTKRFIWYMHFCGGTLVSPTKIVSAAHCFTDRRTCWGLGSWILNNIKGYHAVMGSIETEYLMWLPNNTKQWRELSRVTIHPDYDLPKHDIAIVYTKEQFILNANVNTLNYSREFREYSGTCMISGFGMIDDNRHSEYLRKGYITLYPLKTCTKLFGRSVKKGLICTSILPSDTGRGDSGGPLVCSGTKEKGESPVYGILVGITSGGLPEEKYSFFTRVSEYHQFITDTAEGQKNISVKYLIIIIIVAHSSYARSLFYIEQLTTTAE